jgi:hypothetical protein
MMQALANDAGHLYGNFSEAKFRIDESRVMALPVDFEEITPIEDFPGEEKERMKQDQIDALESMTKAMKGLE